MARMNTRTPTDGDSNRPGLPPRLGHLELSPIFQGRERLTHTEAIDAALALVDADDDYLSLTTPKAARRNQGPAPQ